MHLLLRSYDLVELQRVRSELVQRGIKVHVSDEFTYAIPGMPGAEQPRGLWVALDEDLLAARRIACDLLGEERLELATGSALGTAGAPADATAGGPVTGPFAALAGYRLLLLIIAAALAMLLLTGA
ncbi:MAG: DUF2007 domain-containing protein [Burkholderiaceae bacterium]